MKEKLFVLFSLVVFFLSMGCTHGHCRNKNSLPETNQAPAVLQSNIDGNGNSMTSKAVTAIDKVKVYKADGSLQCGMGKPISVAEMQKQLGSIKVYKSENKNDGMMRIQMCGASTGQCNVYEINKNDLPEAQKMGFKEWTFE